MGDALALRGEEGRDKLRKATGIGTYELIRGCPNGATHRVEGAIFPPSDRWGGEPGELKHLSTRRKRKQIVILRVVASESGTAQTLPVTAGGGLKDCIILILPNENHLGRWAVEGESPVLVR